MRDFKITTNQEMSELKKFLFDTNDFNDEAIIAAENAYTEEQLLLAKEQGFAQGKEEGVQQTRAQQEERIAHLLQNSLAYIDALIAMENRREVEKHLQALDIALKVINKTVPAIAKEKALEEIETNIKANLKIRKDEKLINIYVPQEHLEQLQKRINDEISQKGYSTQINIVGDAGLATTDCRMEWVNGGTEKAFAQLLENIEKEFISAKAGLDIEAKKADEQPAPDVIAKKAELDAMQPAEIATPTLEAEEAIEVEAEIITDTEETVTEQSEEEIKE